MPSTIDIPLRIPAGDTRLRTASRIFRGSVIFHLALSLFWLATWLAGGSRFFSDASVDAAMIQRVLGGVLVIYVAWGIIWWLVKAALLRYYVGFDKQERQEAFSSRMSRPYDVAALVTKYKERRIRIADMIGRRGRFVTLASAGFYFLYVQTVANPEADFAAAFFADNLLDGLLTNWIFIAFFYANGLLAAFFYGPQSRVMDGTLARANCLLITTLWTAFKFVMVPIGAQLAAIYPRAEFAPVFALIWGTYLVADASAEIFGSLFGRQKLKVWGIGDVNRKSITGVVAAFTCSLIFCVVVIGAHGLGTPWFALALVLASSNCLLELFSPRGTDDFTMATANALLCWGFGAWLY